MRLGELDWLLLLLNDWLELILWSVAPKTLLARALLLLVSASHLGVFVRLLQS